MVNSFDYKSALALIVLLALFSGLWVSADPQPPINIARATLQANGYTKWIWLESHCESCDIQIISDQPLLLSEPTQAFLHALSDNKFELMALYQASAPVSDSEYNLLAQMCVGILGRESTFFTSRKYWAKENIPFLVPIAKFLMGKSGDPIDSRGPTQIKIVPKLIHETYGIVPQNLYVPENAAIATMGFLIESLDELKNRITLNHLKYINPSNYVDYLPYIYLGETRKLIAGSATPDTNIYVQDMKKYMGWIEIYERPVGSSQNNASPILIKN